MEGISFSSFRGLDIHYCDETTIRFLHVASYGCVDLQGRRSPSHVSRKIRSTLLAKAFGRRGLQGLKDLLVRRRYGGFHKWGYPQSIHSNRSFYYKTSILIYFLGTPISGTPHLPRVEDVKQLIPGAEIFLRMERMCASFRHRDKEGDHSQSPITTRWKCSIGPQARTASGGLYNSNEFLKQWMIHVPHPSYCFFRHHSIDSDVFFW